MVLQNESLSRAAINVNSTRFIALQYMGIGRDSLASDNGLFTRAKVIVTHVQRRSLLHLNLFWESASERFDGYTEDK
ncbi:unnamed protein product [Cylicostephanus goldi]|uniref:Uncharacterized protein n=1 Tax=Cylicostephanus goldi TaxID=71465 RepID=A0A3P7N9J5_CYLGO|nr:unnamed protein product [Cylicostephanus goldi]